MTIPRPTIKVKKAGSGPVPGNSHSFPKTVKYSHLLACEITHSYKNYGQPDTLGPFSPSPTAHTLSVECVSPKRNPLLTNPFVSHQTLSEMRHREPELH